MIYRIKVVGQIDFEKSFKCGNDALSCGLSLLPESPYYKVYIYRKISKGYSKGRFKHLVTLTERDLDKVPC